MIAFSLYSVYTRHILTSSLTKASFALLFFLSLQTIWFSMNWDPLTMELVMIQVKVLLPLPFVASICLTYEKAYNNKKKKKKEKKKDE